MKKSSLSALAIVTGIVLAVAGYAVHERRTSNAAPEDLGRFVPGLADHVNDVAKLRIIKHDGETTIVRQDDRWVVADKSDFPARFENVKEAIVALSRLEIEEPKTKNPDFYERLGVQDPEADGSTSSRLVLEDAAGKVLADVIVGQSNFSGGQSVYVRGNGEEQAFLCSGRMPSLDASPKSWLDRDVVKVDTKDVAAVRIVHPDGEEVQIERMAPDSSQFEVENKPAGREEKYAGVANSVASNLAYLTLDDVRPAGQVDFDANLVATTEFRKKDGQVVVVQAAEQDGQKWIRLSSRYEEPPAVEGPAPAASEETGEPAEAEGGDDAAAPPPILPDETPKETAPDPDEVRKEVESFNERVTPWAFAVPAYKFDNLDKRMEDLLKPQEEGPAPPPEDDAAAAMPPDVPTTPPGDAGEAAGTDEAGGDDGAGAAPGGPAATPAGADPPPAGDGTPPPAGDGTPPAGEGAPAGGGDPPDDGR